MDSLTQDRAKTQSQGEWGGHILLKDERKLGWTKQWLMQAGY